MRERRELTKFLPPLHLLCHKLSGCAVFLWNLEMKVYNQDGDDQQKRTFGEPVMEMRLGVEEGGHDEMQQCPELGHVVLDGGPTQQQAVSAGKTLERLPPHAAAALYGLPITHTALPIRSHVYHV